MFLFFYSNGDIYFDSVLLSIDSTLCKFEVSQPWLECSSALISNVPYLRVYMLCGHNEPMVMVVQGR